MKVDVRVPNGLPHPQMAEFIKRCEDAGFSGVGVPDHQHSGRDAYITMALAAANTSRISLFPGVTNPVTRHPMVLANLAMAIDEYAPGRVGLMVGSGFLSTNHINRKTASLAEMRAAITTVRRLLAGESVYPGITEGKMARIATPPPPVYIAATGPRMLELVGEVADGGFLHIGLHPKIVSGAREFIAQGARRAGRDGAELPITLVGRLHFEKDLKTAQEWARNFCFGLVQNPLRAHWLREAGVEFSTVKSAEDLSQEQLAQICEIAGFIGPPDYCLERLRQVEREMGVSRVFLQPSATYEIPEKEVEIFKKEIAPHL